MAYLCIAGICRPSSDSTILPSLKGLLVRGREDPGLDVWYGGSEVCGSVGEKICFDAQVW